MELVYSKRLFNLVKIFLSKIFKIARLEQMCALVYFMNKSSEIYRRICDMCWESGFSKINVYKWAEYGLAIMRLSLKKQSDSLVMKMFRALWSVKKVMRTVYCDINRAKIIDFLENGATVSKVGNLSQGELLLHRGVEGSATPFPELLH